MITKVIKSDGSEVVFDPERLNKAAIFGDDGNGNWSHIALDAYRRLYDGCTTKEVNQAIIDACISRKDEAHARMAGRVLVGQIYKEAFGGFTKIPSLPNFYHRMVDSGYWEDMKYTGLELTALEAVIDHSKDLSYGYAVLKQFRDKYGIKDAVNDILFESPQMMFMGMAMAVMKNMPKARRIKDVTKLYTYLSDLKINAPTPYLNGLRTGKTGYASCCVIKADDTAKSIGVAREVAYTMTVNQAGIGYYLASRSIGDGVRGNTIKHMGKLPYYRGIDAGVKENRQQSRGGSATVSFLALDPQIDELIRLRNPMTVTSKRINTMDYSVGINKSFVNRVAKNLDWMLVSYKDAPQLHDGMFTMTMEEFDSEVDKIAKDASIPKTWIKARDLAIEIITQRTETGRLYVYWTDEMNRHTPFKEIIYSSNLCCEISLPTKGYSDMRNLFKYDAEDGEVALCFLASLVAGRVKPEEYEDVAYYTVLMIDNVMDIMTYPYENMESTVKKRRSIGVGITNVAHYIATHRVPYGSPESKQLVHDLAELHSYSLHKASLRLAKERGVCEWIGKTKYPSGWLPIDTYNKAIDSVVEDPTLKQDWESLRKEIIDFGGIRNSVLEAYMPNESSSLATNTTNGIYPVRDHVIFKKSPQGQVLFIVPDYEELKDYYTSAWDTPTNDMIDIYALFQKFTGQTISADLYLDYTKQKDGKISMKEQLGYLIKATKVGMKTWYYLNSKVGAGDSLTAELHAKRQAEEETKKNYPLIADSSVEDPYCESCAL
ncbi:ribonucleoside-diphosphate reductase subunit alpha [Escherichia coli]|uniref:Ribonucleoside-diphosphate reductase n=1 Tax=Escherichia phage 18-1-2 TaxID=2883041 RepID=A0A8K1QNP0_9CAUD|nr:ribonucleoside-diphosphate reductase subunit alpha [Escherichia coli]UDW09952.1 ribonucleotide reductase of class Ia (aerobic), alpha subunit [Escherichia phage 18-1-2]UJQ87340.1 ribonucleotide reductase of class Ia (aerobic), alpha subunit [Escherichia phage 24-2-1]UJQ87587.1 ribonucleotide reductase of class Ia (aerobic), alpha subunit [Escherichia phage 19-1-2]UOX40186.1 ribonucleotide reductase of class Ia (aerobic), alpha subunit [Escherichia phage vB_EcoM_TH18]